MFAQLRLKTSEFTSLLRSPLVRDRAATLLTVWSNCLAGWWLGGGGRVRALPFLFVGASLLYVGGTLWADAFAIRPGSEEHPPAAGGFGPAGLGASRSWGLGLLLLGVFALAWCDNLSAGLGLALAALLVVARLPRLPAAFAFVWPPLCRVLLYLIGASTGVTGVAGVSVWPGLALACYVLGVVFLSRLKTTVGPERHWPMALLAAPICLALLVDNDGARQAGLLLSAVVALWTVRCLRPALWSPERDFAGAVGGLVAGIALVDLLAVAQAPKTVSAAFVALFLITRLVQQVSNRP